MSSLVVFYSRTGISREVAESVSSKLKCDTIELTDKMNWKGFFGFLKGGFYSFKKKLVEINPITVNISDYENIYIISPIWAGVMTPTIRSFVTQYQKDMDDVNIIFTSGGGDIDKAINDFKEYFKDGKCVGFTKKLVISNKYLKALDEFLN